MKNGKEKSKGPFESSKLNRREFLKTMGAAGAVMMSPLIISPGSARAASATVSRSSSRLRMA